MAILMRRRPLLRATAIGTGAYVAGRMRQQTHLSRGKQTRVAEPGGGPAPRSR
jgi:hypothetical protein